ncbi:MAG: Flp family type IVb pilin [Alphaproteobacteria bacterium]
MCKFIKQYLSDEDGATAIEYGLIVAGVGLAITAAVVLIGVDVNAAFTNISSYL